MLQWFESSFCKIRHWIPTGSAYKEHSKCHWTNNQTLKNHLIEIFCTRNFQFPMAEWIRMLQHAVKTMNLLRSSRLHPSWPAHAYLLAIIIKIVCLWHTPHYLMSQYLPQYYNPQLSHMANSINHDLAVEGNPSSAVLRQLIHSWP